jgi:hypothetical protein
MGSPEASGDPVQAYQYCADFSDTGGMLVGHSQQINMGYVNIFATGNFMSACHRCYEKETVENTWSILKAHFAAGHHQHNQIQRELSVNSGYHAANTDVGQNEDQMAETTSGALANLTTVTATDRDVDNLKTSPNNLKRSRHYSKKIYLKERMREHPTLHHKTIIVYMDTRCKMTTQARAVTIPRMDTNAKLPSWTPCE